MTPEKRTRMYLTAAVMGLAGTVTFMVAETFGLPAFISGLSVGILLVALVLLLVRRLRDEYIEQLWNAGASWAFVAVVLTFIFTPFLEGFYDGITGAESRQDLAMLEMIGPFALLAFFAGFHIKWLRTSL